MTNRTVLVLFAAPFLGAGAGEEVSLGPVWRTSSVPTPVPTSSVPQPVPSTKDILSGGGPVDATSGNVDFMDGTGSSSHSDGSDGSRRASETTSGATRSSAKPPSVGGKGCLIVLLSVVVFQGEHAIKRGGERKFRAVARGT